MCDDEEQAEEEESKEELKLTKEIGIYEKAAGKKTEMFLTQHPDNIMEVIEDFCVNKQEEEFKVQIADKQYKAQIVNGKNNVVIGVKVLKIEEEERKFCVDFTRKQGDLIEFLDIFKEIKLHLEAKFDNNEEY